MIQNEWEILHGNVMQSRSVDALKASQLSQRNSQGVFEQRDSSGTTFSTANTADVSLLRKGSQS